MGPVTPVAGTARYVVVGPADHGVVIHAERLAAADPELGARLVRIPPGVPPSADELLAGLDRAPGALLHVTDHLFGRTAAEAAQTLEKLARRVPLALVLHDVPQPQEGAGRYARRRAAYRAFAARGQYLVVASRFEASLLEDLAGAAPPRVRVIPLPLEPGEGAPPDPPPAPTELAVLGFLHPGKGVEDVVDVAAALSTPARPLRVTSYGAVAAGHADDMERLVE